MFRLYFTAIFRLMAYQGRNICVTVGSAFTYSYISYHFHVFYILYQYNYIDYNKYDPFT
jgi:hypothetical protein